MKIELVRSLSLKIRITIALLLVSIFSVSTCTIIYAWLFTKAQKDHMETTLKVQSRLIAEHTVTLLAFNDITGLEEIIKKIKNVENLEFISIKDKQNRTLASFGQKKIDFEQNNDTIFYYNDYLISFTPISYGEDIYGSLTIILSNDKLKNDLAAMLQKIYIFSICLFLINLALIVPLKQSIIKPIIALSNKIRYISKNKDYNTRIELVAAKEVNELIHRAQQKAETDLINMTQELIKQNNELQRFAYITSHDLRAPIVNIMKLLEFVDEHQLSVENKFLIEKIKKSVHKLNETLGDLIQVVSSKNNLNNEVEEIFFDQFFKELIDTIDNQIKESGLEVVTIWESKKIYYVKSHLTSIFINLLTNSIKYRHPNRIPKVTIKTYPKDNYICIEVSDNGLGFDLKVNKNNVFGLHKRFHSNIEGKGIGLFLVKTLVESLGGYIEVESTVNEGTTFYIYLKNKI